MILLDILIYFLEKLFYYNYIEEKENLVFKSFYNTRFKILSDEKYEEFSLVHLCKRDYIYKVIFDDGSEVSGTDEHKLFDYRYEEIKIKDISIGDIFYDYNNFKYKKVKKIKKSIFKWSTCDLTVDDKNHRYVANGILVHNCVTYDTTIDTYKRSKRTYTTERIYDVFYKEKIKNSTKNKNLLKLEYWLLKKIKIFDNENSYKLSNLFWQIYNLVISFRLKIWKYNIDDHEIIDSVIPKEDTYVYGLRENSLTGIHIRPKHEIYELKLENGFKLSGASDHLVYLSNGTTKALKDLKFKDLVITKYGYSPVLYCKKSKSKRYCFDLTVNTGESEFFSNGILSHNSVISGIYITWYLLNNVARNVVITSQNEDKVKDLMEKIECIMRNYPFYLKLGIVYKSILSMKFDNKCRLLAYPTTENTAAGVTAHLFYCDEFALIHKNIINKFFRTIFPTMSSDPEARMIITSTARGRNKFYDLYNDALNSKNRFNPIRTDWWEVPEKELPDGTVIMRGEEWKQAQIADLGSEEDFNQEFGNQFDAGSDLLFKSSLLIKLNSNIVDFVHRDISELDEHNVVYKGYLKFHPLFNIEKLFSENCKFLLTIDLGEGVEKDYSDIGIYQMLPMSKKEIENLSMFSEESDFFKMVQIGHYRSNNIPIEELAEFYYKFTTHVLSMDNCKGVIELNFDGRYFKEKVSSFEGDNNMFEPDSHWVNFPYNMIWENAITFKQGIQQTEQSKEIAAKKIKDRIKNNQYIPTSKITIEELSSMAKSKSGSYRGQLANDDAAMSALNGVHFLDSAEYKEWVDELLEKVNPEFIELINKKLNRKTLNDNGIGDLF
jgi:hypothetical protein